MTSRATARSMEQMSNDAAVKDAQILLRKEEYVFSMEQMSNYAKAKSTQILLRKEEYVLSMVQKGNDAAVKDAQIKLKGEEYAKGTGHIAMHKMNLLHLVLNTRTLLQLKHYPISVLLGLHRANQEEELFLKR